MDCMADGGHTQREPRAVFRYGGREGLREHLSALASTLE